MTDKSPIVAFAEQVLGNKLLPWQANLLANLHKDPIDELVDWQLTQSPAAQVQKGPSRAWPVWIPQRSALAAPPGW